jgi:hypothetical protein
MTDAMGLYRLSPSDAIHDLSYKVSFIFSFLTSEVLIMEMSAPVSMKASILETLLLL